MTTECNGVSQKNNRSSKRTFSSVQSVAHSCPTLCDPMNRSTPGLPVHHNSRGLLKFMSIESVMPSSHLILCCHTIMIIWVVKIFFVQSFPGGSEVKASACNVGDLGLIRGSGRSPGEGTGNPLQYSCLENPMGREAWWATVHGVKELDTTERLHFHFLCILATSTLYLRLLLGPYRFCPLSNTSLHEMFPWYL